MPKIVNVVLSIEVSDDELSNLLARLGEGEISGVSAVDTATGEVTEHGAAPAPAAVQPTAAAPAADKPKGRGRPPKDKTAAAPAATQAPAASVAPPMPTAAPVGMPGMPAMPAAPAALPPISYEAMAAAYGAKHAEGKITDSAVVAKYSELGLTDPNTQLQTDESARRKMYDWLMSL